MKTRLLQRKIPDTSDELPIDLHPLLKRIYLHRGVRSAHELERGLNRLISFEQLFQIEKAVELLYQAFLSKKRILIVGDFDADGATSSTLACLALRIMGAAHVDYIVPNRFEFGYGLTPEIVAVAMQKKPEVLVTVDNGISSLEGVHYAKAQGLQVLITDHHLPGKELPCADAIVNPNQPNCLFPSKNLAGVGVIFYVMLALRGYLRSKDWFAQSGIAEPNMAQFLDLVALGTYADVVPLDHNNRILVYQGLRRIQAKQCRPGILALLEIAGRDPEHVSASALGFVIGPRLNAAGRLDDMSLGIECLLTDNLNDAREIARELDQLNQERRSIELDMKRQAFGILRVLQQKSAQELPTGLCLFDPEWHQGVIGIVASRIKDQFHRPVIAFALANEYEIKGSARSIEGLHIRDTLDIIATQYPHILQKFGGHAMAAGLSLKRKDFEEFSRIFAETVQARLSEDALQKNLSSDGRLEIDHFTLPIIEKLQDAGPFGQAFPEPLFDGDFDIIDQRLVSGKHLKLQLKTGSRILDAIAFNVDLKQWPNQQVQRIQAAFRLDVNEYRGTRKVQLVVELLEAI